MNWKSVSYGPFLYSVGDDSSLPPLPHSPQKTMWFRKKSSSPRGLLVTHCQSAYEATNGRTIFTKK